MESAATAILASVLIAVIGYWLNGWRERSFERRRVNYSEKVEIFNCIITDMNILWLNLRSVNELFRILPRNKNDEIQGPLFFTHLNEGFILQLPDKLKNECDRLSKNLRLWKDQDIETSAPPLEALCFTSGQSGLHSAASFGGCSPYVGAISGCGNRRHLDVGKGQVAEPGLCCETPSA